MDPRLQSQVVWTVQTQILQLCLRGGRRDKRKGRGEKGRREEGEEGGREGGRKEGERKGRREEGKGGEGKERGRDVNITN